MEIKLQTIFFDTGINTFYNTIKKLIALFFGYTAYKRTFSNNVFNPIFGFLAKLWVVGCERIYIIKTYIGVINIATLRINAISA
jgi:hypothetical protein